MLNKLHEDSYIFGVPGKFPEAYGQTIEELERRKVSNIATERICYNLQKLLKQERKSRDLFNEKYGDYLPLSIQCDLSVKPIDILFNQEESETSQNY